MKKILSILFAMMLTGALVSAFACDGKDKKETKDDSETRVESTSNIAF